MMLSMTPNEWYLAVPRVKAMILLNRHTEAFDFEDKAILSYSLLRPNKPFIFRSWNKYIKIDMDHYANPPIPRLSFTER